MGRGSKSGGGVRGQWEKEMRGRVRGGSHNRYTVVEFGKQQM